MSDQDPLDVFGDGSDDAASIFPTIELPEDSTFGDNEAINALAPEGKISKRYLRMDVFKVEFAAEQAGGTPMGVATVHYIPYLVLEYQAASQDGNQPAFDKIQLGDPQYMKLPFQHFNTAAAARWDRVSMRQIDQWFTELLQSTAQMARVPMPKQILAMGAMAKKIAKEKGE